MADAQSRSYRFRVSGIAAHVREGAAAFPCQLEELAADGAFLRTDRVIEVGLDVEFRLVPPDDFQRLVAWLEEMKSRATKASAQAPPAAAVRAAPAAVLPAATTDPLREDGGDERSKLMLQIKGLLLEMDDLRDRLQLRDIEVDDLRRQLFTAEQLLGRRTPS